MPFKVVSIFHLAPRCKIKLIFCDETGSSFNFCDDFSFRDGDFFIYGGIAINSAQYLELEKFFAIILKDVFKITSRFDLEIHAGDIFYRTRKFSHLTESEVSDFFSELAQLMAKFNVKLIACARLKTELWPHRIGCNVSQLDIVASCISGFFYNSEQYLARTSDNGIIIADSLKREISPRDPRHRFKPLGDAGVKIDQVLERVFYDMQRWRIDPNSDIRRLFTTRYKFESMASFLLDNIHYTDSRYSPMTQLTDCMLFILSRCLNKIFRAGSNVLNGDNYEVPLDFASLGRFLNCVELSCYSPSQNDFVFFAKENIYEYIDFFYEIYHGDKVDPKTANSLTDIFRT